MPKAFCNTVAFKNPRDQLGERNVLLQSFPTTWKDSLETFHHATARPYGYLVLDLHLASSDQQRLLSHLLKDEGWTSALIKSVAIRHGIVKTSRRLQGFPPQLFWICWKKIVGDYFHSMRLDDMNYSAMREVYNLVRNRQGKSIDRFIDRYNETYFRELV